MSDADYHERREAQERAAAGISLNPAIQTIHRDLADRHARIAAALRQTVQLRDIRDRDGKQ